MPRSLIGEFPRLLTPAEAADMLRVNVKTLTRHAEARNLTIKRTPGGHRRYLQSEVRQLAQERAR